MEKISHDLVRLDLAKNAKLPLAFDPTRGFEEQRDAVSVKFAELLGVPEKRTSPTPIIEFKETSDPRFDEIRFTFESEPGFFVPAHMLLPKGYTGKIPVVICLQGHSTGMHISLGRVKYPGDEKTISGGDRDFAIQAVSRGYAAIAMEQRGFGELDSTLVPGKRCAHPTMQAFMLGRTLIGERTSDISRLIDAIAEFDMIDLDRIGLMGNSGGGTATYHAACIEKRVKVAMPSCSFNTYYSSIMSMHHCVCNYIPGILEWMEMPDLALMIAPRPLVVVNGKDDKIFPLPAVLEGFEIVRQIYAKAGAPDNCRLVIGDEGHRFYAKDSWPQFDELI